MKELREFIKTTIREYLNEQQETNIKLNDNFWKWFGNSKVKENGKPLVVYHGSSSNDVKIFDLKMAGKNTDSGMYGKGFYFTNDIKYASTYNRNKDKGSILSCFLSIQNPLIINSKNDIPSIKVPDENIEDLYNAPINYSKLFREYLIDNNYDGVIDNLSIKKEFVVLKPNQIKSIQNDGTWDIADDNIFS